MWAAIVTAVLWVIGKLTGRGSKAPSPEAVQAEAKAVAQTQLVTEQKTDADLASAARARSDADQRVVLNAPTAEAVTTDRSAPINTDPDLDLRD